MKRYIFLLILLCFFFFPKAYAVQTNYDSYFNITYTDKIDFSRVVYPNGDTLKDYMDYATNIDNSNYYIITSLDFRPNNTIFSYNGNNDIPDNVLESWYYSDSEVVANARFYVWLVPKSVNSVVKVKLSITTLGGSYENINFSNISSSYPVYKISTFGNLNNNYEFLDILDDCLSGNCSNYVTNDGVTSITSSSTNSAISVYSQYFADYNTYNQNLTYTNSSDANLYAYSFIYSSQVDLIYNSASNTSSSTLRKSIYYPQINTSITINDNFLTYTDVISNNYIMSNKSSIQNILVGNINDLSNFNLNLKYNYSSYDNVSNINYSYLVFGRLPHYNSNDSSLVDYYSYDQLNCSADTMLYSNAYNLSENLVTTSLFPYGLTCSNTLTDYDSFYIRIDFVPFDLNYTISNLSYEVSQGNLRIYDFTSTLLSQNGLYIYESFIDLPTDFSILLSTNQYSNKAYYYSDNKYLCFTSYYTDKGLSQSCLNPIYFGNTITGAMLYNLTNYNNSTSNVDLLLNYDTILSFGSNGSGSNSTFYYYDNNGDITDSIISNKSVLNYDDTYSISSYTGELSNYLEDHRSKFLTFGSLVNDFYQSFPDFLKSFILISFILVCIWFIYLLIRKW